MKLKGENESIQPFPGDSNHLIKTSVPTKFDAVRPLPRSSRKWYLENPTGTLPPCISSSEFIPKVMIEHLMRHKKDGALGVKFIARSTPPDAITNMEGAMHTFITPIVLAFIHGDYIYRHGHGVSKFPPFDSFQQARSVIISAQIQPDFENSQVMLALSSLQPHAIQGQELPDDFSIPAVEEKQSTTLREKYDAALKRHMIYHLIHTHHLPSLSEINKPLTITETISFLENFITDPSASTEVFKNTYTTLPNGGTISLELLSHTSTHQLRNELSALELLCPQGYIYTSDPASIFARRISSQVLNRLQISALKILATESVFRNMQVFAFNDFADKTALSLLQSALGNQPHIRIVAKKDLFRGRHDSYSPLPDTQGALLVLHNNSDGFGQNVETEWEAGSLDGAIGVNSSAAASLRRDRTDLLDFMM